ncbi:BgTH12-01135 [Blumeria graminis f. sp. triticale]|nr:BgTH12-01135 [Blumeria graminis f. sp. triticale]
MVSTQPFRSSFLQSSQHRSKRTKSNTNQLPNSPLLPLHFHLPLQSRKKRRRIKVKRNGTKHTTPINPNFTPNLKRDTQMVTEGPRKKRKIGESSILVSRQSISIQQNTAKRTVTPFHYDKIVKSSTASNFILKDNRKSTSVHQISSSWIDMPSSAQKGLHNPAVLCYRNSLLQALLHSPKLVNWLRSYHRFGVRTSCATPCVACRLLSVFNSYWSSTSKDLRVATKELDKAFISAGWQNGRSGRQEDPEEQLVWLAKVLSEQLPTNQFSAFEAISRFTLNSNTKCSSCGYLSVNKGEIEGTLSIDLRPKIKNGTIADYLRPYFSYWVEDFKCDRCSSRSPKQRNRKICHQPDTLVIQLKRFGWDGRKDNSPIPFSSNLSLNQYRNEGNTYDCEYELTAVICHIGVMNSGHYICRAKGPDKRWMKFDDLKVSEMTIEQAIHPGTRNGWTPYLLFYQRTVKDLPR